MKINLFYRVLKKTYEAKIFMLFTLEMLLKAKLFRHRLLLATQNQRMDVKARGNYMCNSTLTLQSNMLMSNSVL